MKRAMHAALLAACLSFSAVAQAPADVRVALVIGNAAYASAPLANPINDARAMSETLKGMGFSVVEVRDAKKAEIEQAIVQVRDQLRERRGVGLLYYAGHGLQLDWRNYMVPVDARLSSAADVRQHAVDVQQVVDAFKSAGNTTNIVVLDACRDNPFAGTASGKGLAQMDAPPGTFLAFATAPGNVAEDGDARSGNGLYTRHLVKAMKEPGARIEDVFKRVRYQVRRQSEGRQIPWEATSLEDDFYFDGAQARMHLDERRRQQAFDAEKADWDRIARSTRADDFYAFLEKHPNGTFSEVAASRIERLQRAKVEAQPDRDGRKAADLQWLHKDGDRYEFELKDGYTGIVRRRAKGEVRYSGDDLFETIGTNMGSSLATRDGFVVRDLRGTFDPPWPLVPTGMFQVGKKWAGRSILTRPNGHTEAVDIATWIAAKERIKSAFGEIDTYRVEVQFKFPSGERHEYTFWYEPGWGYAIRLKLRIVRGVGSPDLHEREMVMRERKETR
jgi:hypothetical protein